jgi:hypothetical protein
MSKTPGIQPKRRPTKGTGRIFPLPSNSQFHELGGYLLEGAGRSVDEFLPGFLVPDLYLVQEPKQDHFSIYFCSFSHLGGNEDTALRVKRRFGGAGVEEAEEISHILLNPGELLHFLLQLSPFLARIRSKARIKIGED